MDPNLTSQLAMNGGTVRAPMRGAVPAQRVASSDTGVFPDIDLTPKIVAAMVAGAALTILLLRLGGFRFSFGANLGGGS